MAKGIALALAVGLGVTGCAEPTAPGQPAAVTEIRPGLLEGYLAKEELPDSLKLLPPPPQPGSAALAWDEEVSAASLELQGSDRWRQAIKDADISFPAAADSLEEVLGFRITESDTPYLYLILRRTLTDAAFATSKAKNYYQRKRPFLVNGQPTGTPGREASLGKDGSYPSGHAAAGWAWALILSEVVPDCTDSILARGYRMGQSRVICNVHWQNDVDAGRLVGAAVVARLHADEDFLADLEMARREAQRKTG